MSSSSSPSHAVSPSSSTPKRLPVTILSGFLGAGKTTLLSNILNNKQGLKVALIVNDMSEINIDAQLVAKSEGSLKQVQQKLVAMQNGCICCTLREDLLIEVTNIAKANKYDYLIIESTGIGEPMQVAETFTFELPTNMQEASTPTASTSARATTPPKGKGHEHKSKLPAPSVPLEDLCLSDVARLDCMVTVIDAKSFHKDLKSIELLSERYTDVEEEDDRTIVTLLIEQVEFANVVLINKVDLVNEQQLKQIDAIVRKLNPTAKIYHTKNSEVPLNTIMNTNLFDFAHAATQRGWLKELRGEHTPETEEYGIRSFVYRRRRPFHPRRLRDLIDDAKLQNVVRSKGFFWLATRMAEQGEWGQAGEVFQMECGGEWFADLPVDQWPEDEYTRHQIAKDMEGIYGDRRQEIVFIGIDLNQAETEQILDSCLLTDEELAQGPEEWAKFEDPFDPWEDEEEDDEEEEGEEECEEDHDHAHHHHH